MTLNLLKFSVSIAVGAAYVRKYFQEDSKAAALEMVDKVREEYGLMLQTIEWMDEDTREIAVKKLDAMLSLIGYSDELLDDSKIEKFYENLKIDASNYLSFFLSINVFDTDWVFKQLREPVVKNDWRNSMPPFIVNAFYAPDQNGIRKNLLLIEYVNKIMKLSFYRNSRCYSTGTILFSRE